MQREFYSVRTGKNKNAKGFQLDLIKDLFSRLYSGLSKDGYFDEYFGSYCVDEGDISGRISAPDLDMTLKLRKQDLWPIPEKCLYYDEDDLLDVIEYLFTVISKPLSGTYHSFSNCGMHWEKFDKKEGEVVFREKINNLLDMYENRFELSENGEVLLKADNGFEQLLSANIPTKDINIEIRINTAIRQFRRHGSNIDDRRQAVRDLADVLEYIRPRLKTAIENKDEADLFTIANNFGIRHHNDKQKTAYDAAIWLSWMFYFFLSTIHVALRKIDKEKSNSQI